MARIAIIHYRSGEKDGVSLEIEKRKKIFEKLGHEVFLITGFDPRFTKDGESNIFCTSKLDIKTRFAALLRELFFKKPLLASKLAELLYREQEKQIKTKLASFLKVIHPDLVFVHNIFSHAFHLPATTALLSVLDEQKTKVVAVHHDFFWEREYFKNPKYAFISTILNGLPPKRDYIVSHVVINSLAKKALKNKRGIEAKQIIDYLDFSLESPKIDNYNTDMRGWLGIEEDALVILHATRITERKAIENAILFVEQLQKTMPNKKCYLLLSNFIEADANPYYRKLRTLADKRSVKLIWIGDRIGLNRREENGSKFYSFWDAYAIADLVTYTSVLEGYGNQLLEAVWAKKLIVLFEYPVYTVDIKNIGLFVVSLGDTTERDNGFQFVPPEKLKAAAKETAVLIANKTRLQNIVLDNFAKLAKTNDSILLKKELKSYLQNG